MQIGEPSSSVAANSYLRNGVTVRKLCTMELTVVAVAGWSAWPPGYPPCVPGGA